MNTAFICAKKRYTWYNCWQAPAPLIVLPSCILLQQVSEAEIQTDCYWGKKNHFIQCTVLASNHSMEPLALVT